MIIKDGTEVAIRANVRYRPNGSGEITWTPVTPGDVHQETVACAVNARDALLAALRFSVSVHRAQGLFDLSERMAVKKAEAAIAKAEGAIAPTNG